MTDKQCDVAIIGAGIVGLAVGLQLVRKSPGLKVVILDKENEVASHQTGHNSGIIHSGLYYKPGSLKARLCVTGSAAMVEFCEENAVPYHICGKIIVATEEREIPGLNELLRRQAQACATSPAATASLMIGKEIVEMLNRSANLNKVQVTVKQEVA